MIKLPYGDNQRFRMRHGDINLIGSTDAVLPAQHSVYRLNQGEPTHFYLEPEETSSDPPRYPYGMRTPGCHRLRHMPGWFNLEIPVDSPLLTPGWNRFDVEITAADGAAHSCSGRFHWTPEPVALPLDLRELGRFASIQDVGQAVNGLFELDRKENLIRTRQPVGSDSLFLLGSPAHSQEATYRVRFGPEAGIYLGLSDFFSAHLAQDPALGIKPGYCTNGLATLDGQGNAQLWMAWGDNLMDSDSSWVVRTPRGKCSFAVRSGVNYRVRHQLLVTAAKSTSRFRIWPEGTAEPGDWLCEEDTGEVAAGLPRNPAASFGLFQYFGSPTEWSDILVRRLSHHAGQMTADGDAPAASDRQADAGTVQALDRDRVLRFCKAMIRLQNPAKAAVAAGFPQARAQEIGTALLRKPQILQPVQAARIMRNYAQDSRYQRPRSPVTGNVYYCCSQKTGSQWLKNIFLDPTFYHYSGLKAYPYVLHGNRFASFSRPFPDNTIVSHLYVGYDAYASIPKPDSFKTFYVLRDPRDILVSWYYSARYSHVPIEPIPQLRNKLADMDFESGMLFMMDFLLSWDFFACQRSWVEQGARDPNVRIFRYEQMAEDEAGFLRDLFSYLGVDMPADAFADVCESYSFARVSGGRAKGQEDQQSHYRSGRTGDWRSRFNDRISDYFDSKTGDLVAVLGYSED
jgi:hypothetical protein